MTLLDDDDPTLFPKLTDEQMDLLRRHGTVRPIKVGEVLFREGQEVPKGQPLLTIDPRPYEAALAQARANLERDRAIAKNAQADVQRYADLMAKEYVTAQQFDQAKMAAAS